MLHPFVHLYPELSDAVTHTLVLTTTERLRRNLIRAYNEAQVADGRRVWPTPRVQTLNGYLISLYHGLRESDPDQPVLLGVEAEYQLFRSTAPDGAAELVPMAQQAWNLCHEWGIGMHARAFSETENGQIFSDWCERIGRRLSSLGAITRAELPSVAQLRTDEPVLTCLAFEQLPQALGQWLQAQNAKLNALSPQAPDERQTSAWRTSFDSSQEELAAVAQWARQQLEADPEQARIGIVVPDLASRYDAVLRQFTAVFDPLLTTGTQGILDIGGGTPLGIQPIWRPARDWLALCFDQLPAPAARSCLNNPYLSLPRLPEMTAALPPSLNLQVLARQTDLQDLDPDILGLAREAAGARRRLQDWLGSFRRILELSGWTGRNAGSHQFQAWQEIDSRLINLGRWSDDRTMTAADALRQADQFLQGIVFAPERSPAPIQILGYLETTGLDFTHLWVLGLDDESWPRLPTLNPFIPARLLKDQGVPRMTPESEVEFATERLRQWLESTDRLLVSHARHLDESERRPSPLIRHLPNEALLGLQPGRPHPGFEHQHDHLERLEDHCGRPLPGGAVRGGTGRIRDQAVCPFRGFAIHRLGLKEIRQPRGLPDALDRGVLIHEALHRLYENARSDAMAPGELGEIQFGQAADQALAMHYGRFPVPFRHRERERLITLLGAWNQLEARREGVHIEDLESGLSAEFGGIGLNLRIDRVDRLGDAHIVIDYKTGRVGHQLTHDRLLDPQLPLYALTNESVQGVLYAEVNETRPRLKGIAAFEVGEATLTAPAGGSWDAQRVRWREQIDTLTGEIRTGLATVTPYDKRACQLCHLQAVCRVGAQIDDPEADSVPSALS